MSEHDAILLSFLTDVGCESIGNACRTFKIHQYKFDREHFADLAREWLKLNGDCVDEKVLVARVERAHSDLKALGFIPPSLDELSQQQQQRAPDDRDEFLKFVGCSCISDALRTFKRHRYFFDKDTFTRLAQEWIVQTKSQRSVDELVTCIENAWIRLKSTGLMK